MHNLDVVLSFELSRTFRRPSFWLATLFVPLLLCGVFALMYVSNSSGGTPAGATEQVEFAYVDDAGVVDPDVAAELGGRPAAPSEDLAAAVREGRLEAAIHVPADVESAPVTVDATDRGLFENGVYDGIARTLVTRSVSEQLEPALAAFAAGEFTVATTTYDDGVLAKGADGVVAPIAVLVLFYLLILMLANHMLNATVEEKEHRIAEVILTSVTPGTLLGGKVVALVVVGLVQLVVTVLPVVAAFLLFRDDLRLPALDLTALVVEPGVLAVSVALLLGGFGVFASTLLAVGAMLPTAKDAGSVFGGMMGLLFIPFYVLQLVATDPGSVLVRIFTFFPYTSAVTAMLRNAFGTLDAGTAIAVVVLQLVYTVVLSAVAVRVFRVGAITYTRLRFRGRSLVPAGS